MPTAQQQIAQAASQLGHKGDYNIYNAWYWKELNGYSYDPGTAWCAAFQSWVSMKTGLECRYSASAAAYATQFRRVSDFDVEPGDVVLFNWDGRTDTSWADHVGLVEWSTIGTNGYFGTIEGNTGNSDVARVTRRNNSSYFTAFFRPTYSAATKPKGADKVKLCNGNGGKFIRFYKPGGHNGKSLSAHRYARSKATIDDYLSKGYKQETTTFTIKPGGTVPVYRMRNSETGDDLYSTSLDECKAAEKNDGYAYNCVPFIAPKAGKPVRRFFNTKSGEHLYTGQEAEIKNLRSDKSWKDEGIAFYADAVS